MKEKFNNLSLRQKLIIIYVNQTVFTLPLLWYLFTRFRLIDTLMPGEGADLIRTLTFALPGWSICYVGVTVIVGRILVNTIIKPIRGLETIAKSVAAGDADVVCDRYAKDEVGEVYAAFRTMIAGIKEQAVVLGRIADNDYGGEISPRSENDIINNSIISILSSGREVVSLLKNSSSRLLSSSEQISSGSQVLAGGSSEQAAAIEQLTATISAINEDSDAGKKKAEETLGDMEHTTGLIEVSIGNMTALTTAMNGIEVTSRDIAKVISVIDDIAFQTNILALNAAVEAARAGVHGKGFAVVADEVRNLASKSALAAKETAEYIAGSLASVREGGKRMELTAAGLEEVSGIAKKTTEVMRGLSAAYEQQNRAIEEFAGGIAQIASVVQSNSAASQEAAAASQELTEQAVFLQTIVNSIKGVEVDDEYAAKYTEALGV